MSARANILERRLSSKEAARLLGVSEASVKRWADSGRLPMIKTIGGHRRFRPQDIAIFKRDELHKIGRPAARTLSTSYGGREVKLVCRSPKRHEAIERLYESLIEGNEEAAAAILVRLHLGGHGVAEIFDSVLCPAMHRIGDLWHRGEVSVAQEHLASRTALVALEALRAALRSHEKHGKLALCCAVEEDFHELPVHLATLTLKARGWSVINLGANTPLFALTEAVGRFTPRLVCVSSTVFNELDRAVREYAALNQVARRCGAELALGGAAFAEKVMRRRFPASLYAKNFKQLEEFAVKLSAS